MSEHTAASQSPAEIFGSDRMWGLKELPLPEPVSWWPQTPGWYVLSAAVLAGLAWFGWRLYLRHQHNSYRKEGLAQLAAMSSNSAAAGGLPILLRRSALHAASREDVAGLRGDQWIAWLNQSAGRELFNSSDADVLDQLAFAGHGQPPFDEPVIRHLLEASREWMRVHRAAV